MGFDLNTAVPVEAPPTDSVAPAAPPSTASAPDTAAATDHGGAAPAGNGPNPYLEEPDAWARIGRGMTDVYRGAEVMGLRGLQHLLPGSEDFLRPYEDDILRNNAEENALYQRGRGLDAGIDWWRGAGQVAASAPVMLVPALGVGLRGAMATGALQGGLAGAAATTGEGGSMSLGALEGAVGGAALGGVVHGVVAPAIRTLVGKYGSTIDPRAALRYVVDALKSKGTDFGSLSDDEQKAITRQIAETLRDATAPRATGLESPESRAPSLDGGSITTGGGVRGLVEESSEQPSQAKELQLPRSEQTSSGLGQASATRSAPDSATDTSPEPVRGTVFNGRFLQSTVRSGERFSPSGSARYTNLAGRPIDTIDDLAEALRDGTLAPKRVPVDYVLAKDGTPLILNTRTSMALEAAGIPRTEWYGRNQSGRVAFTDGQGQSTTFDELAAHQLARNPKVGSTGSSSLPRRKQ